MGAGGILPYLKIIRGDSPLQLIDFKWQMNQGVSLLFFHATLKSQLILSS